MHLLLAITITIVWCVVSFHTLHCDYLAWYIVPCLVLVLFSAMHHLRLAFLLFVVVRHPLPCTATTCFGALLVPWTIIVVCCGSLSLALHYYFCDFSPFALHYCCLLWWVILCIVFLIFVMVCRPSFYIIAYCGSSPSLCLVAPCCGASPSPYVVVHCGSSFHAFSKYSPRYFVVLACCGLSLLALRYY